MEKVQYSLLPEVAAVFALASPAVRLHLPQLGRTVDLRTITLAEAETLMALPGGFKYLVRLEQPAAPKEKPETKTGAVAETTAPAKGKKKSGARGGE